MAEQGFEKGPDRESEGGEPVPERKKTYQHVAAGQRMKHTQLQIDEVVDKMNENLQMVLEKDQKLSELEYQAEKLEEGASMFEKQAGALKNKLWLKNRKMMVIISIMGLIVLSIIYLKFIH